VDGGPGVIISGGPHAGDAVEVAAQLDLANAYNTVAGNACSVDLTGQNLGGLTLTPGVYCFSTSAQLTGILTLNFLGDPSNVFIFQIGTTLTTASSSSVALMNAPVGSNRGSRLAVLADCNVYWQVGSSATLGGSTAFKGNILALSSITLNTSASLSGRALARNGAVTLDTNAIVPCPVTALPVELQRLEAE
jgi:Ice-binding-like